MQNEHLEHHVNQHLVKSRELSSTPIEVIAQDGDVTLRGTVQTFRRKLRAQEIAAVCTGVKTVLNELMVDPTCGLPDDSIAQEINRLLHNDNRLNHQTIRIDVVNGTVSLTGYVANAAEKQIAADIAASIEGAREIKNLMIANVDRVHANSEHCKTILASISGIIGMEHEQLVVAVIDETARVSGKVDSVWKKEAAESMIRKFGILEVCNSIVVTPESI
ncbi:MAG: osmotically-inducible protein OsmY [Mariniblastus sp.]|jgi:osmotically-inducible protein OsmY